MFFLFLCCFAEKIQKKYSDINGSTLLVDLNKGLTGLGISLAGNRDRTKMSVFICGMHPKGSAFKDGRLRIGDEILEVGLRHPSYIMVAYTCAYISNLSSTSDDEYAMQ